MKMGKKVIIPVVALILVVGAVIGTVMVVSNKNDNGKNKNISANQKAVVETMCQDAEDKQFCQDTLGSVSDPNDPKAYIAKAVESTVNNVIKALNLTNKILGDIGSDNPNIKMALDGCKDLFDLAIDSLQFSTDLLRDGDINTLSDRSADFRNWQSAVVSHQQFCILALEECDTENQVKSQLEGQGLGDIAKFSAMALDIIAHMDQVLEQFGLKLDVNPSSRSLLDVDSEGYPSWVSASDRQLVQNNADQPQPNAVVAKDGSGQFKTIKDAINAHPGLKTKNYNDRYVIFVKAGIYKEYVNIPKTAVNILIYGEGIGKTVVTGNKSNKGGVDSTSETATFINLAHGFIAKSMTFENSAGPEGHQAVAFRNQGDMSAIFECSIVGYQDSLLVQTNRQFYKNCEISGTIDFIFGESATIIQSSKIILRKPLPNQFNTVTADGTQVKNGGTGIVIQNCDIIAEEALMPNRLTVKSYLGRPWKNFSTTAIMESRISDAIHPEGWKIWDEKPHHVTSHYVEYNNEGLGANVQQRVNWPGYKGLINKNQAAKFTARNFLKGKKGDGSKAVEWMNPLSTFNIPFDLDFTKP